MRCFNDLLTDREYKFVAYTRLDEGQATEVTISTVWIGLDLGSSYRGGPYVKLIYETMVFLAPEDRSDPNRIFGESVYCDRHPTEEAARAGHDQAVAWAKQELFMTVKEDITNDHHPET